MGISTLVWAQQVFFTPGRVQRCRGGEAGDSENRQAEWSIHATDSKGAKKNTNVFLKLYTAIGLTELLWVLWAQNTNEFPQEKPSQHEIWQADSSKGPCYQQLRPEVSCWHQAILRTKFFLNSCYWHWIQAPVMKPNRQITSFVGKQRNFVIWYYQSLYFNLTTCFVYSCKVGYVWMFEYILLFYFTMRSFMRVYIDSF